MPAATFLPDVPSRPLPHISASENPMLYKSLTHPCRYYNANRLISNSCCTTRKADSFPKPKNLPHTGLYSTCCNSFYPVWMLSCITVNIPGNKSQFPLYDPPCGSPIPKAEPSKNQIQPVKSCHISTSVPTPHSGVPTFSLLCVPD